MSIQAAMFDLDGTLADTLADIASAANHAMAQLGQPVHPVADYRYLAGQGLPWMIEAAIKRGGVDHPTQAMIDKGIALFREYYAVHRYDQTKPFDGIVALLHKLANNGARLAVLSNKPHDATCHMVEQLFGDFQFDAVVGHKTNGPLKPDPSAALAICREADINPQEWAYVGDTAVDMQTGKAANMLTVGVTWGFRPREELLKHNADAIIDHPAELLAVMAKAAAD